MSEEKKSERGFPGLLWRKQEQEEEQEEGGRRKEEGGRRKEEGGSRKGGRRKEEAGREEGGREEGVLQTDRQTDRQGCVCESVCMYVCLDERTAVSLKGNKINDNCDREDALGLDDDSTRMEWSRVGGVRWNCCLFFSPLATHP